MTYVIQSTHILTNTAGKTFTHVSYFREHRMVFNCMENDTDKAKKYDFKTEANRDKRKYFGTGNRGVKVVKTNKG